MHPVFVYTKTMTTWHPPKRRENARKHGVDLAIASGFEWDAALVEEDTTEIYGEQRFRAIGPIGDQLYVYVYTLDIDGVEDHAISLRRAEPKERKHYVRNI